MPILILQAPRQPSTPAEGAVIAFTLTEAVTGRVGGFLALSQMITGHSAPSEIVLDTYVTGDVRK